MPLWPAKPTPGYAPKGPVPTTYSAGPSTAPPPPPPVKPPPGSGPPVPIWPDAAQPAAAPRGSGRTRWVLAGTAALVLLALGGGAALLFLPTSAPATSAAGGAASAAPRSAASALGPTAGATTVGPPVGPSVGSGVPAASPVPGTYRQVDDLCAVAKDGALTQLYPTRTDVSHESRTSGTVVTMWCGEVVQSQPGAASRRLTITAEVSTVGSIRPRFDAERSQASGRATTTTLTGLGSAAFWYQDQDGTHVVGSDGNLIVSVVWDGRDEPDLLSRLTDVCRLTTAALKV
jgi:hypothetical protein